MDPKFSDVVVPRPIYRPICWMVENFFGLEQIIRVDWNGSDCRFLENPCETLYFVCSSNNTAILEVNLNSLDLELDEGWTRLFGLSPGLRRLDIGYNDVFCGEEDNWLLSSNGSFALEDLEYFDASYAYCDFLFDDDGWSEQLGRLRYLGLSQTWNVDAFRLPANGWERVQNLTVLDSSYNPVVWDSFPDGMCGSRIESWQMQGGFLLEGDGEIMFPECLGHSASLREFDASFSSNTLALPASLLESNVLAVLRVAGSDLGNFSIPSANWSNLQVLDLARTNGNAQEIPQEALPDSLVRLELWDSPFYVNMTGVLERFSTLSVFDVAGTASFGMATIVSDNISVISLAATSVEQLRLVGSTRLLQVLDVGFCRSLRVLEWPPLSANATCEIVDSEAIQLLNLAHLTALVEPLGTLAFGVSEVVRVDGSRLGRFDTESIFRCSKTPKLVALLANEAVFEDDVGIGGDWRGVATLAFDGVTFSSGQVSGSDLQALLSQIEEVRFQHTVFPQTIDFHSLKISSNLLIDLDMSGLSTGATKSAGGMPDLSHARALSSVSFSNSSLDLDDWDKLPRSVVSVDLSFTSPTVSLALPDLENDFSAVETLNLKGTYLRATERDLAKLRLDTGLVRSCNDNRCDCPSRLLYDRQAELGTVVVIDVDPFYYGYKFCSCRPGTVRVSKPPKSICLASCSSSNTTCLEHCVQLECDECPPGATCPGGDAQPLCNELFFQLSDGQCRSCNDMAGADCTHGRKPAIGNATLGTQTDWWAPTWLLESRPADFPGCPPSSWRDGWFLPCRTGHCQASDAAQPRCSPGYRGPRCDLCAEESSFRTPTGTCIPCASASSIAYMACLPLGLAFFYYVFVILPDPSWRKAVSPTTSQNRSRTTSLGRNMANHQPREIELSRLNPTAPNNKPTTIAHSQSSFLFPISKQDSSASLRSAPERRPPTSPLLAETPSSTDRQVVRRAGALVSRSGGVGARMRLAFFFISILLSDNFLTGVSTSQQHRNQSQLSNAFSVFFSVLSGVETVLSWTQTALAAIIHCLLGAKSYPAQYALKLSFSILLVFGTFLYYYILFRRAPNPFERAKRRDEIVSRTYLALFFLYSPIVSSSIAMLDCSGGGPCQLYRDGLHGRSKQLLFADLDVECWGDPGTSTAQVFAILSLLFWTVGVPVFLFVVLLLRNRGMRTCWGKHGCRFSEAAANGDRAFLFHNLFFFTKNYRSKYYFWEPLELAKLGIFSAIFHVRAAGRAVIFFAATTFAFVTLVLYVRLRPFRLPTNNIHAVAMSLLLCSLCFSWYALEAATTDATVDPSTAGSADRFAIFIRIVVLLLLITWMVIFAVDFLDPVRDQVLLYLRSPKTKPKTTTKDDPDTISIINPVG